MRTGILPFKGYWIRKSKTLFEGLLHVFYENHLFFHWKHLEKGQAAPNPFQGSVPESP